MQYEERLGDPAFLDEISAQLKNQAKRSGQFLVIPPGGTLLQAMFR